MFRDELEAALARANQLERELAEMKTGAERAERQVTSLQEINAQQQRELEGLRRRLGEEPPARPRSKSASRLALMIVAGVATAAGIGTFLLIGGSNRERRRPPTHVALPTTPAPVGAEATSFSDFVRGLGGRCSITRTGFLANCKPKGLRDDLRRAEERVGSQAAMLAYCRLLSDQDSGGALARLAAHRMRGFYGKRLEAVDAQVYRCLDSFVRAPEGKAERTLGHVVYTWAQLGAQQKESDKVLETLKTLPSKVRADGYRGLWRVARLKVLPQLESALLGDDVLLVAGTVEAFGYLKSKEEIGAVCPLLIKAMNKHTDSTLRSRIAYRAALSCKDKVNGPVLAAARVAVESPRELSFWWVAAVRHCARARAITSAANKETSSSLLAKIITDTRHSPHRRGQALSALEEIDKAQATKLARRYLKGSPGALRRAAEGLLK